MDRCNLPNESSLHAWQFDGSPLHATVSGADGVDPLSRVDDVKSHTFALGPEETLERLSDRLTAPVDVDCFGDSTSTLHAQNAAEVQSPHPSVVVFTSCTSRTRPVDSFASSSRSTRHRHSSSDRQTPQELSVSVILDSIPLEGLGPWSWSSSAFAARESVASGADEREAEERVADGF